MAGTKPFILPLLGVLILLGVETVVDGLPPISRETEDLVGVFCGSCFFVGESGGPLGAAGMGTSAGGWGSIWVSVRSDSLEL